MVNDNEKEGMLVRRIVVNLDDAAATEPDEGWWVSVLSEEDLNELCVNEGVQRSETQLNTDSNDWERIETIYDKDEVISLVVYGYNRGGLLMRGQNIQGFVPISHILGVPCNIDEEKRAAYLALYVGRTLQLKVIECEPAQERVVLSERAAQAGEGERKRLLNSLKTGDLVEGVVTNLTEFGAFVDLGGVEGLVHVSELSWGRVQHPYDILHVGQTLKALVLQVCQDTARVALSQKRLLPNPWEDLEGRYQVGDVVSGNVTDVTHFGAFVRLDEGVEGLIHISSISMASAGKTKGRILCPGELVKTRILHLDVSRRRLGLDLVDCE